MKTTIYTALFGDRDILRSPCAEPNVRHVCFTDNKNLSCEGWETVWCVPTHKNPCMAAKIFKLMPQWYSKHLQCDRSIWVDANLEIIRPIVPLFDRFPQDIALVNHPTQDCVFDEIAQCIREKKDNPNLLASVGLQYLCEGHPKHWTLPQGRVIFRVDGPESYTFNSLWWQELKQTGLTRDQVCLPIVLRRSNTNIHLFKHEQLFGGRSQLGDSNKCHRTFVRLHDHKTTTPVV